MGGWTEPTYVSYYRANKVCLINQAFKSVMGSPLKESRQISAICKCPKMSLIFHFGPMQVKKFHRCTESWWNSAICKCNNIGFSTCSHFHVHFISFHLLAGLNIDGIDLTQGISRLKCFPSCCENGWRWSVVIEGQKNIFRTSHRHNLLLFKSYKLHMIPCIT